MRLSSFAVTATLALSACAVLTDARPPPAAVAPHAASMPKTPIAVADLIRDDSGAAGGRFAAQMLARYPAGAPLSVVQADLTANSFACTPPPPPVRGAPRGDPPVRICRREIRAADCKIGLQVHLFSGAPAGRLGRLRALYDRRCGADGLLGGPG